MKYRRVRLKNIKSTRKLLITKLSSVSTKARNNLLRMKNTLQKDEKLIPQKGTILNREFMS